VLVSTLLAHATLTPRAATPRAVHESFRNLDARFAETVEAPVFFNLAPGALRERVISTVVAPRREATVAVRDGIGFSVAVFAQTLGTFLACSHVGSVYFSVAVFAQTIGTYLAYRHGFAALAKRISTVAAREDIFAIQAEYSFARGACVVGVLHA
jgi:hypothetical protein